MLTWLHRCTHNSWSLHRQIGQLRELIMATFEEIKAKIDELNATASANAVSVAEVNTRLDGVNTKIDDLRTLIGQGGVITVEQLNELGDGVDTAIATLAGISQGLSEISADITDAEQS